MPLARAALLALGLCGLIGMLLNDAGVTVPAIMVGFALILLIAHLVAQGDTTDVRTKNHRAQELQKQ